MTPPHRRSAGELYDDPLDQQLATDLERSTAFVRRVAEAWRPRLIVHGHLHHRHEGDIQLATGQQVSIVGLGAESMTDGFVAIDSTAIIPHI